MVKTSPVNNLGLFCKDIHIYHLGIDVRLIIRSEEALMAYPPVLSNLARRPIHALTVMISSGNY